MNNRFSDMSCFVVVAESATFTEAARKLGVAKSSVSYRMAVLEKRLGVRLLDRGRKTVLTREGQFYYEKALKVLEEVKAVEESIANSPYDLKGIVRVSMPVTFSDYFSPMLARFSVLYPNVLLDIDGTDKHISFRNDDYDVAIRMGVNDDHSLIVKRIAENEIVMCASPAYIEQKGIPRNPYDLKGHEGIIYRHRLMQGGWKLRFDGRDEFFKIRTRLVSDNALMMLSATLEGVGISLLPRFLISDLIKDGKLVKLLPDCTVDGGDVSVAYRLVHRENSRVKALVDFLCREIEKLVTSGESLRFNGSYMNGLGQRWMDG
ncbi:TPA: LysR family transcriptional regulator [Pseudomonas aeruginosa]